MSYLDKDDLLMLEELKIIRENKRRLSEIAHYLDLPVNSVSGKGPLIEMTDLWNILKDENKFKNFVAKIKLIAFT